MCNRLAIHHDFEHRGLSGFRNDVLHHPDGVAIYEENRCEYDGKFVWIYSRLIRIRECHLFNAQWISQQSSLRHSVSLPIETLTKRLTLIFSDLRC